MKAVIVIDIDEYNVKDLKASVKVSNDGEIVMMIKDQDLIAINENIERLLKVAI